MIRIALLSRSDAFHRQIWNAAKEREGVRIELRLRSLQEAGELREIDVLVVHNPAGGYPPPGDRQWAEFPSVVFVGCEAPATSPNLPGGSRSFVAEGIEAERVLVAAEATAHGFVVVDPECVAADWPPAGQPVGARRAKASPLTERELEVVSLLASGKTNQQIANTLGITSNTVKFHLAGIYGALDVNSRAEAVVAAIRGGLISM